MPVETIGQQLRRRVKSPTLFSKFRTHGVGKKGDAMFIIMMIILLLSFAVILYFVFRINFGAVNDEEICHNSVIMQAVGKGIVGTLNCKTKYVCISGGDKCEGITAKEIIKVNAKNKEEIIGAIADEMKTCYWMFGEGKLDYTEILKFWGQFCGKCSVIGFDKKIQEAMTPMSYIELYSEINKFNMPKENIQTTQTYLEYFYGTKDIKTIQGIFNPFIKNYFDNNFDFSKNYFIMTGVWKSEWIPPVFPESNKQVPVTILERTQKGYSSLKYNCNFLTEEA